MIHIHTSTKTEADGLIRTAILHDGLKAYLADRMRSLPSSGCSYIVSVVPRDETSVTIEVRASAPLASAPRA